ncbi:MAG: hypothetical protein FWD16_06690, partial [Clostridia bacterium]|nr:hypothetical protein [Clostridia bacterium]
MTPRQRLLTTIARQHLPDHVPVAPDTSNMIPCRLTGKPFWDIYLWKDIPQWMAYIDCAKYFGFDALMDGYAQVRFEDMDPGFFEQNEYIVGQDEDKIITRTAREANGKLFWSDAACVYYRDNPPTGGVALSKLNLPQEPGHYEKVIPRNTWPEGEALIKFARE